MCCVSIFSCIMTIISNSPIIYTFREHFLWFFFYKCNILLHLDVILILVLLTIKFFSFQNQLHFLRVLLKIHKRFSYNLFCNIKYVCFLCHQMLKFLTLNICKEYVHIFLLLKNFSDCFHIHLF